MSQLLEVIHGANLALDSRLSSVFVPTTMTVKAPKGFIIKNGFVFPKHNVPAKTDLDSFFALGKRKQRRPLRFEYWKSNKNRQWYWRIKSGNSEIVAQSEGYKSKASVLKVFHVLFDFEARPELVDLNQEAVAKFLRKKPKNYEGKLNRNWP